MRSVYQGHGVGVPGSCDGCTRVMGSVYQGHEVGDQGHLEGVPGL